MKIDILTLFPEMFSPLEHSIVGKAREKGLLDIQYHNFRENAEKARHVDDEPYGGGQGMLLRAQRHLRISYAVFCLKKKIKLLYSLFIPTQLKVDFSL
ncbi:RNA methyltransferase [Staphylococcus aureus]